MTRSSSQRRKLPDASSALDTPGGLPQYRLGAHNGTRELFRRPASHRFPVPPEVLLRSGSSLLGASGLRPALVVRNLLRFDWIKSGALDLQHVIPHRADNTGLNEPAQALAMRAKRITPFALMASINEYGVMRHPHSMMGGISKTGLSGNCGKTPW
jgi:hypothetical protein